MFSSPYCVAEVERNVGKLGDNCAAYWSERIRPALALARDSVVLDKALLFTKAKDKPVLITALAARCDVLLTLDRADFGPHFERGVYGLRVTTPGDFLRGVADKREEVSKRSTLADLKGMISPPRRSVTLEGIEQAIRAGNSRK